MTLASPRLHPQVSETFKLSELSFSSTPDAPAVLLANPKSGENLRNLLVLP